MKKFFLVALATLLSLNSVFAQKVVKKVDEMTDKVSLSVDEYLEFKLLDEKKSLALVPMFGFDKNNQPILNGLVALANGIGCVENGEIIVLFEDGEKVSNGMWNRFNCDGAMYFDFKKDFLPKLNKEIKAIRVTNGRNGQQINVSVTGKDKLYFARVLENFYTEYKTEK